MGVEVWQWIGDYDPNYVLWVVVLGDTSWLEFHASGKIEAVMDNGWGGPTFLHEDEWEQVWNS